MLPFFDQGKDCISTNGVKSTAKLRYPMCLMTKVRALFLSRHLRKYKALDEVPGDC